MLVDKIRFKKQTCIYNNETVGKKLDKQISVYVVTTRKCNTHCKFCEFHSGESDIDTAKLKDILNELGSTTEIHTVHFTGGEPTLELDKITEICDYIKSIDKCINTSVNTNGTRLKELENIRTLDNIALSRHAITDEENFEIFGSTKVPTCEQIDAFNEKRKLHLSCNIIKGYVDNLDKIKDYLELAASLDINDVGLVSLMKINDFCKSNYIDFDMLDNVKTGINNDIVKTKQYRNISDNKETVCMCENYLYRASNLKLVSMYHRYAIQNNEIADYLVYENNHLKQGFNGEIII